MVSAVHAVAGAFTQCFVAKGPREQLERLVPLLGETVSTFPACAVTSRMVAAPAPFELGGVAAPPLPI